MLYAQGVSPWSSGGTRSRSPARASLRCRRSRRTSGISESCLHRWLKLADVDDGVRPGVTSSESAELRELKKGNQNRSGTRPVIVRITREPFAERVRFWCPAGISAEDFLSAGAVLHAACWAADVRIMRDEHHSRVVTVDVIRRRHDAGAQAGTSQHTGRQHERGGTTRTNFTTVDASRAQHVGSGLVREASPHGQRTRSPDWTRRAIRE